MSEEFLTDVAIRLHEVGIGELSRESILAQLDEVIRRWHEAEEKAKQLDFINGRLIQLESLGWQDRNRIDQLERQLASMQTQLQAITQRSMTYVQQPAPTIFTPNTQPGGPR